MEQDNSRCDFLDLNLLFTFAPLKNSFIISLAILLLWCSMGKTGLVISFKANQSYIAQVLCENKAKPEMKCNGKCQLKKQMATQQEAEKNIPVSFEKIIDSYWLANAETHKQPMYFTFKSQFSKAPILETSNYSSSIFHPPALV